MVHRERCAFLGKLCEVSTAGRAALWSLARAESPRCRNRGFIGSELCNKACLAKVVATGGTHWLNEERFTQLASAASEVPFRLQWK